MITNITDKKMNDTQEKYNFDVDVTNVYKTVQKYTENHENANECIEKPQMLECFSDGKISNISDASENFKSVQRQNVAQSNIEGGGELLSNHEKNTKSEAIEMEFEGLNIKNEFITDKVQIIDDRNNLSNDQIKTINAKMKKIQNEMETMRDGNITKELENTTCFKAIVDKIVDIHSHIDQFIEVVNGLKLKLEDACENKETITEIMEVSEYLRAHYAIQVTEDQRNFTEQINKYANEIYQLKAYADIKIKEVDTLEERANDQKLCIDSYEKSMKCITDKFSILYSDIKQLQNENDQLSTPNEKQKEFFLLLAEQLEGMDELLKTTKKERHNMIDYLNNTFEEEHVIQNA